MHLDLADLRLFVAVAEAGSITGGAARAGLALASASARLRDLEAEAGTALLHRHRRGATPSPAGQALLRHARLVLAQLDSLRGELAGAQRGQVRLLANTAAATAWLPELLARFLARHPRLDLALEERPSRDVAEAVASGAAPLGIAADHADLSGLESFPFRTDRLVVVAPPFHTLAGQGGLRFAELLGCDLVGLAGDSALQRHLAGHARRGGQAMRLRIQAQGPEVVCRMVALGAGLAILPEAVLRPGHGLAVLALREDWAERRLRLVARRLATLPEPARLLLQHLRHSPAEPSG